MNTATHPIAPEEVMAFLDGELSSEQAQAVSAHLEACESCGTLASEMRGISRNLCSWQVAASTMGPNNLRAMVSTEPRTRGWLPVRARWGLLAAAGVVLLAVMFSIRGPRPINVDYARVASKPSLEAQQGVGSLSKKESRTSFGAVNGRNLDSVVTLSNPGVAADSNGLFHGLGDHKDSSFSDDGQPKTDQQSRIFSNALPGDTITEPMIARTMSLSIVVQDFPASRSRIDEILSRHHGYSAQLQVSTPENAARSLQASFRFPPSELSAAISELKVLGRVENESQTGEEVTQQHKDLIARLKVARETEERFRSILQQRTGNASEILQVEEGIARVRGDIERMEAEQKNLEHRVDFVTVNLQLIEEYKAQLNPPAPSISVRLHNALVEGYRDASETLLGIVLFFAEYTLTLLIWGMILALPAILLWKRFRRALATV